jgi:hypothetical protein
MIRLALLVLLIVGGFQQSREPQSTQASSTPQDVTVAELTTNPERYDQRIIRAKVQWVSLYHGPLACPLDDDTNCIRINLVCPDDDACKPMQRILTANLEGVPLEDMRARFVVVGRFVYIKQPSRNSPGFLLEVRKIESVLPKQSP